MNYNLMRSLVPLVNCCALVSRTNSPGPATSGDDDTEEMGGGNKKVAASRDTPDIATVYKHTPGPPTSLQAPSPNPAVIPKLNYLTRLPYT